MDTESNKEAWSIKESTSCEGRGKYSREQIGKGGTLQEPQIEKEGAISRNTKENAKKVKNIYSPVKEKLQVVVEYINILEKKKNYDCAREIALLLDFLEMIKNQCDMYLKYKLIETGKNG